MNVLRLQCYAIVFFFMVVCVGCGNSSNGSPTSSKENGIPQGPNVLPVAVEGTGLCGGGVNQPCVTVTVCVPATAHCQTVHNVLLDTGSVGLRIFRSVLTIDLSSHIQKDARGNQIGECLIFGTGADWGPIATAGVILANEPEAAVPIQLIDATFAGQSAATNPCGQPVDTDPQTARFNGILGIDGFVSDQGAGLYFSCGASGCNSTVQPTSFVQNPIVGLPTDNNGYAVMFPAVGRNGAASLTGALILGIGTQSNNAPAGVSVFRRDPASGTITTTYKGTARPGFLDTGSTALFFQDSTIPVCLTFSGMFCPSSPVNLTAVNRGVNQTAASVAFQVANAETLTSTGNAVFDNLGGPEIAGLSGEFDWGLPFFLGRTVYTGIEARASVLGVGPYWAY